MVINISTAFTILMSGQLKREITDRKNVRIPKVVLDALDANVGDVLQYVYDNEKVTVTKYGPGASQ
jgi:bifunctional DNA-binding transcriptional regulator/antitoxin component of YhaV-PrlF toxin-antitoxin module